MKKRILLFTMIGGLAYVTFTSFSGGPAFGSGPFHENRTGAQASITNCGGSDGAESCHGTGTSTSVTITLDSGTVSTTRYVPGHTYTVKIHGTNTSSLPKFGFEFAAVSGSGASQVQAGTFPTPAGSLAADPGPGGLTYVEQQATIAATSPGTYDATFQWVAPSAGVGTITLYCTLNAVNGNASADPGDISGHTSITLTQEAAASVSNVLADMNVKAFPNPVNENLRLQFENAQPGTYTIQVFDLTGRTVYSQSMNVNSISQVSINTTNWTTGIYQVLVEKDGDRKIISIVK